MQKLRLKPMFYWLLWALWSILMSLLVLTPSKGTAVRDISLFFGGTELSDAIGHVAMIFIDTALLYNALKHYIIDGLALRYAVGGTLIFGLFAELAQIWIPSRGTSLIDIGAAFIGVGLFAFIMRKRMWLLRIMRKPQA